MLSHFPSYPPSFSASFLFFFTDTATTKLYTLSLHDALPIFPPLQAEEAPQCVQQSVAPSRLGRFLQRDRRLMQELVEQRLADRKSTRLNSSHSSISYAVFCLKKKKK